MKFTATPAMLAIAALSAFATTAHAQVQGSGWYAGGNVGRSAATIDDERIRGGLAGQGLVTNSIEATSCSAATSSTATSASKAATSTSASSATRPAPRPPAASPATCPPAD
jgi:hypothetical protein